MADPQGGAAADVVIRIQDINKSFPGVQALTNMSIDLRRGEVHAVCGENGAGKSTLMKLITGVYRPDSGRMELNGQPLKVHNPNDAYAKGIAIIFQETSLFPELSILENIFMGHELRRSPGNRAWLPSILDYPAMRRVAREIFQRLGMEVDLNMRVSQLSVALRQMVEIAKALSFDSKILILDEPTAALTSNEVRTLFETIRKLRTHGVSMLYISHRLDEIFEIGDYVTVMRDGKHIDTKPVSEVHDRSELIKMMIGKTVFEQYTPRETECTDVILEARNVSNHKLNNVSFKVHAGEITGFYGLVGAGKTELARAIYGVDDYKGEIIFKGKKLLPAPDKVIGAGITLVPEERRTQGLFTIAESGPLQVPLRRCGPAHVG